VSNPSDNFTRRIRPVDQKMIWLSTGLFSLFISAEIVISILPPQMIFKKEPQ